MDRRRPPSATGHQEPTAPSIADASPSPDRRKATEPQVSRRTRAVQILGRGVLRSTARARKGRCHGQT